MQRNNGFFEISTAYPELQTYFGLLTGFAYTIPFVGGGLFFGKVVNKVNRKLVLSLSMLALGVTMGLSGFASSCAMFVALRVISGLVSSGFNPMSFSLLAEYFPPEKRTVANSVLQSGNYIGWGMSSLCVLAIKSLGWRSTYGFLGAITAVVGMAAFILIKEPARKIKNVVKSVKANYKAKRVDAHYSEEQLEDMKENPFRYLLSNPVNRWVMMGSFIRNIGHSVTTEYLPVFFLKNFAEYKVQYSAANSLVLSVGGLTSSIIAGIIADRYEFKSKMTKAFICMSGGLIALPLYAIATMSLGNFWLSILCHAIVTLFSAAFSGSAITMMQNSSPK